MPWQQAMEISQAWSQQEYTDLIEAAPDALIVSRADGLIVFANSQTEKIFGYRREDLIGRPVEMLMPERFRGVHVHDRSAYTAAPRVRPMGSGKRLYGLRSNGREFPVEISLSPIRNRQEILVVAAIRDVTVRQEIEARYRTLVEQIPAILFLASLDGSSNELYVSPQIESILGFTARQWLEDPILWYRQLHPEDRDRWQAQFVETVALGRAFDDRIRFLAKDGRVVWLHGQAKVVSDPSGRPLYLQGIAYDVSDQVEADRILAQTREQLAEQVRQRTRDLEITNRTLQQKHQETEQFVYAISHDLKAPIVTAIGFLGFLKEDVAAGMAAEMNDSIERLESAILRMKGSVDDLLEVSRIGRVHQPVESIDVNAVIRDIVDSLQEQTEAVGAKFVLREPFPTLIADRKHLTAIFHHLLLNAIQHGAGVENLTITIAGARHGNTLHYSVSDNGPGIDPQFHQKIFALFQRVNMKSEGSGVGLAYVKRAVEHRGGRVWVESTPGQGAAFHIELPVDPPAES